MSLRETGHSGGFPASGNVAGALSLAVPHELVDAIADAVVERLAASTPADTPAGYMNTENAAAYLDAPVSRIHDLVRDGRLHPLRDGRRLLFTREDLDAALDRGSES